MSRIAYGFPPTRPMARRIACPISMGHYLRSLVLDRQGLFGYPRRTMTTANRTGFQPLLRLWAYRRGVAAFIANRTSMPFIQCQDVVEWNWHILIDAYDEGARFQEAGQRILHIGERAPGRPSTH